MVVKLESIS